MIKLNKLTCVLLYLALALTAVFALTACEDQPNGELTDEQKEALRQELLGSLSADMSCAEMSLNMTDEDGAITQMYAAWNTAPQQRSEEPEVDADVIIAQYNPNYSSEAIDATVIFLRGENVLGASQTMSVAGYDKIDGVKAQLSSFIPLLERTTLQEMLAEIFAEVGLDQGALDGLDGIQLPQLGGAVDMSAFAPILTQYFTRFSVTDDGYSIGVDFGKVADKLWNTVYLLAEIFDEYQKVPFSEMYENDEFQSAIQESELSALEMEAIVNKIVAEINAQLPEEQRFEFVALEAQEGESAYEYIGRYLAMEIDDGVTVGDLSLGEIICKFAGLESLPDITDTLDMIKFFSWPSIRQLIASCSLQLNFNTQKQLTGISVSLVGMLQVNITLRNSVHLTVL